MNEYGTSCEEKGIPDFLRCLKNSPGLSISLEPHPQSGDPEVKITELNTGTPITLISSNTYQRPSLERVSRKLHTDEGLKCALNPSRIECNDEKTVPRTNGNRGDKTNKMDCTGCTFDVLTNPVKELIKRTSIGINQGVHNDEKPVKHFQRSTIGLNIGFDNEDFSNFAMPMPLTSTNEGTRCLQKFKLNMQEPIRLPREDTVATLVKARDELLHQSLEKTTGSDKCVAIQTDLTMDDLACQGNRKGVDMSSFEINDGELTDTVANSAPELLKASEDVPNIKTQMFKTLASEALDHPESNDDHLCTRHEHGSEKMEVGEKETLTGETKLNLDNCDVHSDRGLEKVSDYIEDDRKTPAQEITTKSHNDEFENAINNSNVPVLNAKNTYPHDCINDDAGKRTFGIGKLNFENGNLPMVISHATACGMEVYRENHAESKHSADCCAGSSARVEDSGCLWTLHDQTYTNMVSSEAIESVSSDGSINNVSVSDPSNEEADNDIIPLQQQTWDTGSFAFADSLQMGSLQSMKTNKDVGSHALLRVGQHMIKPCDLCMDRKSVNLMTCTTAPLTDFQCCLCAVEISQEAKLLWADIKYRGCLLTVQICLFVIVLLLGGYIENCFSPPPT
ncbi:hypothetical protein KP509_06G060000 [Ceratopteris richardii]|uniref:Uncharacterized protein n=1 Tax=Ceratopteris richardii TaxID=49495 RepID=A0A8T2UGV7_CERRI|nr:hypothetical protein KP509_06G060000 [Ceratopteris richardii]KAH7435324.1 hypothetical protein KP509_06G060000 [Ceratopteris richardii]KAH7435325.1 hypothetical protein KP509_06G060000 [Ceratopteris richardii]KAH7435326.1 hypothetical protein KP509_06G060000 [Ceratopteris richardii]KAH7435327.1 hypothetical protein KP509_06G060000 [Ceratopteris richardii]